MSIEKCARYICISHHNAGGSIRQWSVADVGVSGDPAEISRAPEHVIVVVVENVLKRCGSIQHVSSLRVQYSLCFSR